jgi:hypothetical protein
MQRFDAYQVADRLREEEECDDTSESGEGVEEDCDLSTVISGLSMTGMTGVGGVPLSGYYCSDWGEPPLISPTTVGSKDLEYSNNSGSDPSNSTQPTTLPSYTSSQEEDEEELMARLEPWFIGRQCTLQIRVWHDIEGALRNNKPADPRGLLEDLRQLQGYVPVAQYSTRSLTLPDFRSLERAADIHAISQVKEITAARVAAWTQNPVRDSSDHLPPASSPNKAFKSIKNAWRRLICRKNHR